MVQAAIMGYGTIGAGVAEMLEKNRDQITMAAEEVISLKYVLDLREFPGSPIEDKLIHDFKIIEEDPEILIVVETMGGLNPAYPFVKACLMAGKHVITSNKALVAAYGTELLAIAREHQVNFLFEASVGGGIPIIRPLYRSLHGEIIEEITGILNGTTNYILTKMDREGSSFESALKEAQDLGYAERNPEADVEGYDTCRKIAILTAMAMGKEIHYEDIYTEGITKISDVDFRYADKMGTSIKLFGSSRMDGSQVHAWVAPVMIGRNHVLYSVNDVFNGIMVKGNMVGTTMFYGSGAGKLPTASAVVADMISAARHKNRNVVIGWTKERQEIAPMETSCHQYFVRIAGNTEENRAKAGEIFENAEMIVLEDMDEFAFVTEVMAESVFSEKAERLNEECQTAGGKGILQRIRAEL